jgi:hypothetical protein
VCLRIPRNRVTGKERPSRLQHAYQRDDVRLVRRIPVWLDLLGHHVPVEVLRAQWGRRSACLYQWRQAFRRRGMDRLGYPHSGGRRPQVPPRQKKRVGERLEAGPQVGGGETACWPSGLLRGLSWRECGVLDNCPYGWTLRCNVGLSFPKARLVSDPLDAARRDAGLQEAWPLILRAAQRRKGLLLFEEAARCAQGGAFSDTWARRGQQPEGKTRGKRQGDKVFGALEYFSGRVVYQGLAGRLAADSDDACLRTILAPTTAPLCLIQDGAR